MGSLEEIPDVAAVHDFQKPLSNGVTYETASASAKNLVRVVDKSEDVEHGKQKNEKKPMVSFGRLLFRFADKTDITLMIFGTIGAVIAGAALPCFSLLFGSVLNDLNTMDMNKLVDRISFLAGMLVVLGAFSLVGSWSVTSLWMMQAERQAKRIRTECLEAILRQEVAWFDTHKPGELTTRITQDVKEIQDGINEKVGNTVQCLATFLTGITIGLAKGWQLALLVIGVMPLLAASGAMMTHLITVATKQGQSAYAKAGDVADEVLTSIRTVAAFTGEAREQNRYRLNLKDAQKAGNKKGIFAGASMGVMMLIIFCSYGLAFWFGVWLFVNDVYNPSTGRSYTGGDVLTVFFSVLIGAFSLGQMGPYMPAIMSARAAAFVIYEICDRKSAIDVFDETGERIPDLQGRIEFKDVHFQYPNRPDAKILQGVNFTVEAGKTVALVGHSGCGKSTSYAMIMRFYDPSSGVVLLDGRDIRTLNVRWLREQIGVVNQEPILFATTIKENIRFGKKDATEEEIIAACKASNAHDFVSKLPQGYDTYVGDVGSQLSGGQKQRIAIARALVKNPKILLLDEATSALDNESERVVQEALDRLMQGRTVLVIAHRLSTIQDADRIYVFDAGRVVEGGTHRELSALGGYYAALVQAQSAKQQEDDDAANMMVRAPTLSGKLSLPTSGSVKNPIDPVGSDRLGSFVGRRKSVDKETKVPKPKIPIGRVFLLARPWWSALFVAFIGALVNGGMFPIFSILFSKLLNVFYKTGITEQERLDDARFWALMFVALGAGLLVANFLQQGFITIVGEGITYKLRQFTFRSLLRQNIGFFDEESHSARLLGTALQTDAAMVQAVTTLRIGLVIQTVGTIVVGMIIALTACWKLALVLMSVAPVIFLAGVMQMKFVAGFSTSSKDAYEKAGQLAGEAVANVRTVASFTSEHRIMLTYKAALQPQVLEGYRRAQVSGAAFGFSQFAIFSAFALTFWYGSKLIEKGEITFEEIMRVLFAIVWSAMIIGQVNSFLPDVEKAKLASVAIFKLIDRVPPIDAAEEAGEKYEIQHGAIDFKNVYFHYESRPEARILSAFNLSVPAGKTVALVGPSGCGKSTTVALVQRFYDPIKGSVLIDGKDLKTLHIKRTRQQIGIVSQEPILFATSIIENIRYGRPEATEEEVQSAAKLANIHDFIMNLPSKYETEVGPRGSQLSGGQKQRIAIARAVLKNPRILLLDEATSALDTRSERVVQEALERVSKGRTTLVIAHRLSTIRNADLIAYIDQGRVVEQGQHDELMQLNGRYASLVVQGALHKSNTTVSISNISGLATEED